MVGKLVLLPHGLCSQKSLTFPKHHAPWLYTEGLTISSLHYRPTAGLNQIMWGNEKVLRFLSATLSSFYASLYFLPRITELLCVPSLGLFFLWAPGCVGFPSLSCRGVELKPWILGSRISMEALYTFPG